MAATIVINSVVWNRIFEFYDNVTKKHPNTWNINDTIAQITEIKSILKNFDKISQWSRLPIIPYWKENNWRETWYDKNPWHFAFNRISSNNTEIIYINDAEHQENIHESLFIEDNYQNKTYKTMKQRIRLTESKLKRIIKRCVNEALEEFDEYYYHNSDAANGLARKGYEDSPSMDEWDRDEVTYGEYEDEQWLHDHPTSPRGSLYRNNSIPLFNGGRARFNRSNYDD